MLQLSQPRRRVRPMFPRRSRCTLPIGVCLSASVACCALLFGSGQETPQAPAKSGPEPRVTIEPRIKKSAEAPAEPDRRSNIRIDTTVVLVPVSVTDPLNRFVTG